MNQKKNKALLVSAVQKRTEIMEKMVFSYKEKLWNEYIAIDTVIQTLKEEENMFSEIALSIAHDLETNTSLYVKQEIVQYIKKNYGKNN